MKYFKVDPKQPDPETIARAVQVMKNGGVIVYPTDTIYGLGVDVLNEKAVGKLYLLKQRDMGRPVSLMVSSVEQIEELLGILPLKLATILEKIFPGKTTALLENTLKQKLPIFRYFYEKNIPLTRVGFRIPEDAVCNALTRMLERPISTTSANISGQKNASSVEEVIAAFGDKPDLILDAGPLPSRKPSTIIDFTKSPYLILREGELTASQISKKIPEAVFRKRKLHFVVTFVCSGNICRSPMAEAILKKKIARTRYRDIIQVQSAGTLELEPTRAHYLAMLVSDDNDVSLDKHLSRFISSKIVEDSDLVFCMALNHYEYLREHFPHHKNQIVLLKQWRNESKLFVPSIADPIGHDQEFFTNTFNEIHNEIIRILPYLFQEVREFMAYNDLGSGTV